MSYFITIFIYTREELYTENTENFVENMKKKSDERSLRKWIPEINCNAYIIIAISSTISSRHGKYVKE